MNVLGAVSESLIHVEFDHAGVAIADPPVDTVAATGCQLDTQETQIGARGERTLQGITGNRSRMDAQPAWVGGADKAGRPGQQGRPRAPVPVAGGGHQEGQRLVKQPVLLGQGGTHHLAGPRLDLVTNAETRLDTLLAFMERRCTGQDGHFTRLGR